MLKMVCKFLTGGGQNCSRPFEFLNCYKIRKFVILKFALTQGEQGQSTWFFVRS